MPCCDYLWYSLATNTDTKHALTKHDQNAYVVKTVGEYIDELMCMNENDERSSTGKASMKQRIA